MIEFSRVSKRYHGSLAVDALDLVVGEGQFTVLLGTSGSGKSTTLKMINRLVERDEGEIRFAGRDVRHFEPQDLRRRMGYAIQSVGLFPHWTVEKNIATVPQLLGWSYARTAARVHELMTMLQLDPGRFARRYPHQLSGGQQQRVGVARALAADPEILLMDEPFGALDPVTRAALQTEIGRIHRQTGRTVVMVTHDLDEALGLATHIVLMNQGRIEQQGTPLEILSGPASDFVRDFVGRSDIGIRLLALERVAQHTRTGEILPGEPLLSHNTLREALSAFVARRVDRLPVVDEQGCPAGTLHFSDLIDARHDAR
ncbi:ABC transporter ATP-binding protein [Paludibacterium yongneupense]|uniref:ABC transporter ATP-binding protein n=1 Tax=Paludibacterium yongneupense TaxID=400061 RepID=UPI0004235302|nr:ABC transporter ATP-binding protein [Paludibacterium yongneupense]